MRREKRSERSSQTRQRNFHLPERISGPGGGEEEEEGGAVCCRSLAASRIPFDDIIFLDDPACVMRERVRPKHRNSARACARRLL